MNLGDANLTGSLINGFSPSPGQQFTIVSTPSGTPASIITGQFAQGNSVTIGGVLFNITYNANSVVLTPIFPPTTRTWDGGGTSNDWSEPANWNPDGVPADGDSLVFPAAAPPDSKTNNNNINGLDLDSITINGGGYTIAGNAINLAGGIQRAEGGVSSFNLPITLSQPQTVSTQASTSTILNGVINLNGNLLTFNTAGDMQVNGVISGAGGLTKTGTALVALFGNNTYTGVSNVTAGSLQAFISPNALGASGAGNNTVVANGATLGIAQATNVPETITLNGTGVGGNGSLQNLVANGSISGPITLASNSTVGVRASAGDTLTLNGVISGGANGLTKVGSRDTRFICQ